MNHVLLGPHSLVRGAIESHIERNIFFVVELTIVGNDAAKGDILLQAAAFAALAAPATWNSYHMAKLAGPTCRAAIDYAVEHQPQAHAAPQNDRKKILIVTAPAKELLIGRNTAHIIIDHHGQPQALAQRFGQLNIVPVQIPVVDADAAFAVDIS